MSKLPVVKSSRSLPSSKLMIYWLGRAPSGRGAQQKKYETDEQGKDVEVQLSRVWLLVAANDATARVVAAG